MNFGPRMVRNLIFGLVALIAVLIIAAVIGTRTDWFRNYARQAIISAAEQGTGGKVEIESFEFDESHLTATVKNFVIHGNEPQGSPPFVRVRSVRLTFRLLTSFRHLFDITSLNVDHPQMNVMVLADGRTNIPTPRQKSTSDESALKTVIDLAVERFELTNGVLALESRTQQLSLRGNDFHAQLAYNTSGRSYQGQLSLQPLYVASGRNTPVTFRITLPLKLYEDRVDLQNATITTAHSAIAISASIQNMRKPKVSLEIGGRVATSDAMQATGLPLVVNARNVPAIIELNAKATASIDSVQVTSLRAALGSSLVEAAGILKDPNSLTIRCRLSLGELGALLKVSTRPEGNLVMNGNATTGGGYAFTGDVQAKNLSFREGAQRIANVGLYSRVRADRHALELIDVRVQAFGGEFAGNAALTDFEHFKVDGNIRHLGIRTALRTLADNLPYDGTITGSVSAAGDTKAPGTKSLTARARLSIAPGKDGIPVSGRLNADYDGAADNAEIENSHIALPHTRLNLNGSLSRNLTVALTTADLNDLLTSALMKGAPPVALNHGQATFDGTISGGLSSPEIAGHLSATHLVVEGRSFDSLAADMAASSSSAAIRNGELSRAAMRAAFTGSVGLKDWNALPRESVSADISVAGADLADVIVLAGEKSDGYSGPLKATAHVDGTLADPRGAATLEAASGSVAGQAFDQAEIQVRLADQLVTIPEAYIRSGAGRVDLKAEFRHPRGKFAAGNLNASLQSNRIDLAGIRTVRDRTSAASGIVQVNASVSGSLPDGKPGFALEGVNADLSAQGLRFDGQSYGDFNATARTNAQTVTYNVTSDFAGSSVRITGNTTLNHDYPTTAAANIANLPIERVLVVARRADIPARGMISATASVSGTLANPQGSADLNLTNGVVSDEPIDRLHLRAGWLPQSIDVPQLEVVAGPSRINLSGHYDHPAGNLLRGTARFNLESSGIELARVHTVQNLRPGLGGSLQITARGGGTVREGTQPIISDLNANITARGITAQGKNLGDLKLEANTTAGDRLDFALDSNLAGASIRGSGNARLADGYPLSANLTFNNVLYTHIQDLLGRTTAEPPGFEAAIDGRASVNGPAISKDQLRGELQLTRVNLSTIPRLRTEKPVSVANQGPIDVTLDRGVVRMQSVHLTGGGTDLQAGGSASIVTKTMDLTVNARTDLGILPSFDRDIHSSGDVVLEGAVKGTTSDPLVNGQLTLRNASLNYAGISNGISNANGVIALSGNSASIRNLTAESGGGKIAITGGVGYSGTLRFGLRATATKVRVQLQEGMSATANANIQLSGSAKDSVISGDAVIARINYSPRTDMGAILTAATPPVQASASPSPLLDNMKLAVRVRTSSGLAVESSMAQNLQADMDLRVRGTASEPGVTGRININQGQLVFFGATYTVSSGTIAFYNPLQIDPVLDVSLKTQAQGVEVVLRVTGPVSNMKLSYSSNPPLQFQEIISLLAAGKAPTSDPTLLANQPQQPQQSFQQMGESAILGQAIANPVAGQLQRVFGVSQLKIDPTFQAGSSTPTARLTLQQRIASNLTFTYTSALDDPNGEIVKVEWAFHPQWSAVATRDQNGIFSINFFYQRQFR